MGPASHETPHLIIKMRQFNLQAPFSTRRTFTENLENQTRAVDHFCLERSFEILLLDWRERSVDDDQFGVTHIARCNKCFELATAKQRRWTDIADLHACPFDNIDPNCGGQTGGFFKARINAACATATKVWADHERTRTARYVIFITS